MRSRQPYQVLILTLAFAWSMSTTGCTAIKGMLSPMVCECAQPTTKATQCPTEDAPGEDVSTMELARTEVDASTDRARSAIEDDDLSSETPNTRKLSRREEQHDPLELIEPQVDEALVSRDDKQRWNNLHSTYPLPDELPESAVVLHANFAPDEALEVALVEPGRRIQIFNQSARLADLKFSETTEEARPEEIEQRGTAAVELVRDGSAQILTHWTETDEEGKSIYKLGVFKLVESYIGTAFEAEMATKSNDEESFSLVGTYEFLRGDKHAFIRWIPAAENEGGFDASEAELYKWNGWEGVYRIPRPPPTAPERQEVRSPSDRMLNDALVVK